MTLRALISDPLTHFLLAGLALFALFELVSAGSDQPQANRIVVDRPTLLTFIQYRTKAFDPARAAERLDGMDAEERRRLIDDYVREEALHREALALSLDTEDYVIRRRLVQKLEFIAEDFGDRREPVAEAELARYFEEHRAEYTLAPWITFTHVFFAAEPRGWSQARALGTTTLEALNRAAVPFAAAPGYGDRFLYQLNYVERGLDLVASHFSDPMAEALFGLEPDDETWRGPYESVHGVHLVLVTDLQPGRERELDELRDQVSEDARRARRRERQETVLEAIVGSYSVDIQLEAAGAGDANGR